MSETTSTDWPNSVPLLWLEFLALFVAAPVVLATVFGVVSPIAILAGFVVLAFWLLARTPEFTRAELLHGPVLGEWRLILAFTVFSAIAMIAIAWALIPGRLFEIFRYRPNLWLMIMALYPFFSALPQEIIFRTLFFRRYGRLFPNHVTAITANALAFGLAHLFFGNPVTLAMSVIGGGIFAWAYLRQGSTLLAVVLHSIAGQLIFTTGLGVYFYHGAIPA